jgi:hypothetical protein
MPSTSPRDSKPGAYSAFGSRAAAVTNGSMQGIQIMQTCADDQRAYRAYKAATIRSSQKRIWRVWFRAAAGVEESIWRMLTVKL